MCFANNYIQQDGFLQEFYLSIVQIHNYIPQLPQTLLSLFFFSRGLHVLIFGIKYIVNYLIKEIWTNFLILEQQPKLGFQQISLFQAQPALLPSSLEKKYISSFSCQAHGKLFTVIQIFSEHLLQLSVQFSCSVMSHSLPPLGLQHAGPPCPSPTPGACSNSCPLSQ